MAALFQKDQRVRVGNPTPRHGHMVGQVGRVVERGKGGTCWVRFLGGKALFHDSELEPAPSQA